MAGRRGVAGKYSRGLRAAPLRAGPPVRQGV